jgi:hypothetical protein
MAYTSNVLSGTVSISTVDRGHRDTGNGRHASRTPPDRSQRKHQAADELPCCQPVTCCTTGRGAEIYMAPHRQRAFVSCTLDNSVPVIDVATSKEITRSD